MKAVLDLLHVLLQQHHVVHVFLTRHVNSQVAGHVCLIVANLEGESVISNHIMQSRMRIETILNHQTATQGEITLSCCVATSLQ